MTQSNTLTFFTQIHDYLNIYLPKQRKLSPHTIRSYKKALDQLVDFVKDSRRIPLHCVSFEHLTTDLFMGFVEHLKVDNGCIASSCNTRLAAVRAFLEYAADRDITIISALENLKKLSPEKAADENIIEYMSMNAVKAIIEQPDPKTRKGRRDRTFIILLYDTGARVQEMLDIRLCDLQFSAAPTATLHGKGEKTRIVPLMEKTVQHLRKYLSEFHGDTMLTSEAPLFYSVRRDAMNKLTDRLIRYMIQGYADKARSVCPEVPENVYPHLFRHSRAMHLYQEGMDLTLISQWLGHSQLETTLIYAHADTEQKRKAIAAATPKDNPLHAKLNPARFTVTDEEMLKKLVGLR